MSISSRQSSISLEYESQEIVPARVIAIDRPTIEMLAMLTVTLASVALGSLSWWMVLHP